MLPHLRHFSESRLTRWQVVAAVVAVADSPLVASVVMAATSMVDLPQAVVAVAMPWAAAAVACQITLAPTHVTTRRSFGKGFSPRMFSTVPVTAAGTVVAADYYRDLVAVAVLVADHSAGTDSVPAMTRVASQADVVSAADALVVVYVLQFITCSQVAVAADSAATLVAWAAVAAA